MSTTRKKGLGRGLSALFGDQKADVKKKTIYIQNKILIGNLNRNRYQPRIHFNESFL